MRQKITGLPVDIILLSVCPRFPMVPNGHSAPRILLY